MGVFLLFLLALAAGAVTTLYWVPGDDLGRGYFQMNALILLGLLALALAVVLLAPLAGLESGVGLGRLLILAALGSAFLYYGAIWGERWRAAMAPLTLVLVATTAALLLVAHALTPPLTPLPHRGILTSASLVTSALVLGWSLVTMLLGHWYLIAPKLAFTHLIRYCWVLLGVVIVRAAAIGLTLASARGVDSLVEPHPWRILAGFGGQGMFFWFRLLWGLLIPLTLAVMALHCARRRSNQSATGILYVLVVGSLIGEITAYYLILTTGVPV